MECSLIIISILLQFTTASRHILSSFVKQFNIEKLRMSIFMMNRHPVQNNMQATNFSSDVLCVFVFNTASYQHNCGQ